jgi:membrane-bound inhibitor of C-type lysozyme
MKTILLVLIGVVIVAAGAIFVFVTLPDRDMDTDDVVVVHEETLTCTDGTVLGTQFLANGNVVVTMNNTPYELTRAVAASGERYANSDESFVFWNKGGESMIMVNGATVHQGCTSGTPAVGGDATPAASSSVADLIHVTNLTEGEVITSPLVVKGEARGTWYSEAVFPIMLTDWDGKIIAQGQAHADGEWMTEDFVPFTAELTFTSPYTQGDQDVMKRGTLILHNDNPSGLPENDKALELTVSFAE